MAIIGTIETDIGIIENAYIVIDQIKIIPHDKKGIRDENGQVHIEFSKKAVIAYSAYLNEEAYLSGKGALRTWTGAEILEDKEIDIPDPEKPEDPTATIKQEVKEYTNYVKQQISDTEDYLLANVVKFTGLSKR